MLSRLLRPRGLQEIARGSNFVPGDHVVGTLVLKP